MHNDEPTLLDALNRGPVIREVGEAIVHCTPPHVFGVHGDWGLGKTSFLHQVQFYLTGECPQQAEEAIEKAKKNAREIEIGKYVDTIRTVWFDAWRYQSEDAPVVALLQEMRAQLSFPRRAIEAISRVSEIAIRSALFSMEEVTKKIGFQYSKYRQVNRDWEGENLATALPSHTLREHLRDAIKKLLLSPRNGSVPPRLVVFIDDVDRCDPKAAYRLLEGLKIYLTLDNCVFVLGMNQEVVEMAIGSRMRDELSYFQQPSSSDDQGAVWSDIESVIKVRANAYLEKLCQNVWRLPAVRQPDKILSILLKNTVQDETIRLWISRAVENRYCLPPNPRRLKGLANLIGRLSSRFPDPRGMGPDEMGVREAKLLVVVAYIYQFHQDIYVRWEADPELWNRIFDRCQDSGSPPLFLKSLDMPKKIDPNEKEPVQRSALESTYPDPANTNVFWIQSLILDLGDEVGPNDFVHYLHGSQT